VVEGYKEKAMWNDSNVPMAYFITFRTYGTWLHGDKRGSISRHKNVYGTERLEHEPDWLEINRARMKGDAVILTLVQRGIVKASFKETCTLRGWKLWSASVQTNHAHVVISAADKAPGLVLNALKANATRSLREAGLFNHDRSPWSDKGSTRYLWNAESVASACNYVEYCQ
jgi:REP element-mobilizing transposase RayT